MSQSIAEIHGFHTKSVCQFCGGNTKRDCVTVSIKAGLFQKSVVCMKCLRNALRVKSLQPATQSSQSPKDESAA